MNVPYRPILSSLLRNRTGAMLVAMQIAIALAVLVNAVYIVKTRVDMIDRPTGIDVANVFVVSVTAFGKDLNYTAMVNEDLTWLKSIPGIVSASSTNAVPLSQSGSSNFFGLVPGEKFSRRNLVNYFEVTDGALGALGMKMGKGRWFNANEVAPPPDVLYGPYTGPVVVSQDYADRMFPKGDAIGKTLYEARGTPATIIGTVDHVLGSWLTSTEFSASDVMFIPRIASGPNVRYLVRATPGMRDGLMRQVEGEMGPRNRARAVDYVRSLDAYVKRTYLLDRNMSIFLIIVTALMLGITSLGIFGLATFNVSVRTKQVGTRRAVGALRRDIVAHFLVENWMITSCGVLLGCILALGAGDLLSREYQLPRVDLYYIVGGVVVLWILGVTAAWHPARRAARISPALATRTV